MTIERPVSVTLDVVERRSQILDHISHLWPNQTISLFYAQDDSELEIDRKSGGGRRILLPLCGVIVNIFIYLFLVTSVCTGRELPMMA